MNMKRMGINCSICHSGFSVSVFQKDYDAWQAGLLIQDAFPYLTPAQRELLNSKICGKCYDMLCDAMEG